MSVHTALSGTPKRPPSANVQVATIPAPIEGIDSRSIISSENIKTCLYMYNLVPYEYGVRTRRGYRAWAAALETAPDMGLGVRTIVPFAGSDENSAGDKLFAVTNEGIWDITVFNDTPTLVQAFADTSEASGFARYTHYATDAGDVVLMLADSANGLWSYSEVSGLWTVSTITGVNPLLINFVTVHKQRLWMVERNSNVGWYLPFGSISGAATAFYFGGKFTHGGDLVGLFNWSIDSGAGVDDYLVAVSKAGDVIPYRGEDPSDVTTWSSVGTYFIGEVPKRNRIADEYSGNLYLVSSFGMISMTDLLSGTNVTTPAEGSIAYKIANFVRDEMAVKKDLDGWQLSFMGGEGQLILSVPQKDSGDFHQYVMSTAVEGWGIWRDVPILSFDTWKGPVYFGTKNNNVYVMDTDVDAVDVNGENGQDIRWSILFNYQRLGASGKFKRGTMVRCDWLGQVTPTWNSKFLYDYATYEIIAPLVPGSTPPGGVWAPGTNPAFWDQAIWGGGAPRDFNRLTGSFGMGRALAVAISGNSKHRTTLISADVHWTTGGPR